MPELDSYVFLLSMKAELVRSMIPACMLCTTLSVNMITTYGNPFDSMIEPSDTKFLKVHCYICTLGNKSAFSSIFAIFRLFSAGQASHVKPGNSKLSALPA